MSGSGISWAMQVCTSLQTDNHASTPPLTGRMPFLSPNQQCQSTESHSLQLVTNKLKIGQNNLTQGHIATAQEMFDHFHQVASLCIPSNVTYMVPWPTQLCFRTAPRSVQPFWQGSQVCLTHTDHGTCNVCSNRCIYR